MRKLTVIAAALAAVAVLGACGSGSTAAPSTSAPVKASAPANPAPADANSKALAAARKVLAGYGSDPGDVATITPERLLYMVKQECAERALTGHGLTVARWQREGLLSAGGAPPIPCKPLGTGNVFNDIPKN